MRCSFRNVMLPSTLIRRRTGGSITLSCARSVDTVYDVACGVNLPHASKDLAVLNQFEPRSTARRRRYQYPLSSGGAITILIDWRLSPILRWRICTDHQLAPIRRSVTHGPQRRLLACRREGSPLTPAIRPACDRRAGCSALNAFPSRAITCGCCRDIIFSFTTSTPRPTLDLRTTDSEANSNGSFLHQLQISHNASATSR